ncbi:DNA rep factor C subfamily [Nucleospora cyclopteri]
MLWTEIYKPKLLTEIKTHSQVKQILSKFTLQNMPNLIIHGQPGSGKKTLLYAFINKLYGSYPEMKEVTQEIDNNSTKMEINYLESGETVIINPSGYKTRDRLVIQSVVKKIAETRPISSFFSKSKNAMKLVVIDQAENMSVEAQAALRITMEKYTDHCRIIMLCSELSRLIEPIRSRSLFIRVASLQNNEIIQILKSITEKEKINLEENLYEQIAINANGNCRRAISVLEIYCISSNHESSKRMKKDLSGFKLDWEIKVGTIVEFIKEGKAENMIKIRKEIYEILASAIDPHVLYKEIYRNLIGSNFKKNVQINELAIKFEERLKNGNKPIFHIEAFAANVLVVMNNK